MKVVFVPVLARYSSINKFSQGGTESQIYGISKQLILKGYTPYILGQFTRDDWKDDNRDIDGINIVNIKSLYLHDDLVGEPLSGMLLSKKIARKIIDIKPDIVVFCGRFISYYPSFLKYPKIFVAHHPDAMRFYKEFSQRSNKLNYINYPIKNYMENRIMKNSNAIVTLNKYMRSYIKDHGYKDVYTIPNGIEIKNYRNSGNKNYIMYAGGLRTVKGINVLLKAYSLINKKFGIRLLIIGSGPEELHLKNMVKTLGIGDTVEFIPLLDKKSFINYLSCCSLFILPSYFETFGIVTLEAMACGKAVVASDIPGPQDIITHNYDGFLFPKGNVQALANTIEYCLSNPDTISYIGKNAKKTIEDKYSMDLVTDRYIELFKTVNK